MVKISEKEKYLDSLRHLATYLTDLGIAPDDTPDNSLLGIILSLSREFRDKWDGGLETREEILRKYEAKYTHLEREVVVMHSGIRKRRILSSLDELIHTHNSPDIIGDAVANRDYLLHVDIPKINHFLSTDYFNIAEVNDILTDYEEFVQDLREDADSDHWKT